MNPSIQFKCPTCGEKFPFWLGPSSRIRNGFLSAGWLKCSHCGMVSCQNANWPHALWAWPLAFFAVGSVIAVFQTTESLVILHHQHPGVYGALGGLCMGLCFFISRFGVKLTPMFGGTESCPHTASKPWLTIVLVAGLVAAVALVTHQWTATLISFAVCLIVSGIVYLLQKHK